MNTINVDVVPIVGNPFVVTVPKEGNVLALKRAIWWEKGIRVSAQNLFIFRPKELVLKDEMSLNDVFGEGRIEVKLVPRVTVGKQQQQPAPASKFWTEWIHETFPHSSHIVDETNGTNGTDGKIKIRVLLPISLESNLIRRPFRQIRPIPVCRVCNEKLVDVAGWQKCVSCEEQRNLADVVMKNKVAQLMNKMKRTKGYNKTSTSTRFK